MEGGGAGVAGGVGWGVGFTMTTRGKRLDGAELEVDPEGGVDGGCGCMSGGLVTVTRVAVSFDASLEWVRPTSLLSGSISTIIWPTGDEPLVRTLEARRLEAGETERRWSNSESDGLVRMFGEGDRARFAVGESKGTGEIDVKTRKSYI